MPLYPLHPTPCRGGVQPVCVYVWCVECVKCVECVEYVVCGVCGCACVFVSVSICVIVLNVEN